MPLYRVRGKRGALLRCGVELESETAGTVACGMVVRVEEESLTTAGIWRVLVRTEDLHPTDHKAAPSHGWLSMKV